MGPLFERPAAAMRMMSRPGPGTFKSHRRIITRTALLHLTMPHGVNSQGNSYSTPGGSNSNQGSSYHYSNSNGSYYYANDNGSTYYQSASGAATYTSPSGYSTTTQK